MTGTLDQRISGFAARVVRTSSRRYRAIVAAAVIIVPLLGVYVVRNLGVNADMASMVSNELPHRMRELDYQRSFPILYENLVVVVDAPTPEEAVAAAGALAERLREDPSRFPHVFYPGDEFFQRNALLYVKPAELERLADQLARAQPYLAGLAADGSLRGLATLLTRGVTAARDGELMGDELGRMLERFSGAIVAYEHGLPYRASWSEIVAGVDGPSAGRRQVILVQPALDLTKVLAAEAPIRHVRSLVKELELDRRRVGVRITGDMALAYEELSLITTQTAVASVASFIIVAITMILAFRSVRLTIAALMNMVVGLVCTMGFATAAIGHLNMVSIAFAVLFIGLSDDYGIHFCMRYRELRRLGRAHADALAETARDAGTSICICAVTTAVGFYAFVPTEFRGVAELGLISGTGMFINVLLCFTFLPAFVTLIAQERDDAPRATARDSVTGAVPFPVLHPRWVGAGTVILAFGACFLVPKAYFDGNPLNVRDPTAESVHAFRDLLSDGDRSPWDVSVLARDRSEASEIAVRLRALPTVRSAITVEDLVPDHQSEKLAIIRDIAMFMTPPTRSDGPAVPPTLEQQLAALGSLRAELGRLADDAHRTTQARLVEQAAQLRDDVGRILVAAGDRERAKAVVGTLEASLLGTLPAHLAAIQRATTPDEITLDDLPSPLRSRMVSRDGRLRIEIAPAEDLTDEAALGRFVESVRTVAPSVTGGAVGVYEGKRAIVRAFKQAFVLAVVVIALLLWGIWRSVGDTALVMTPLALAALFTTALSVLLGIPFNFANVIVLPLLFGLGVNSGIHLVERWRLGGTSVDRLLATSTAQAVVYSSLNTIGSFGTLGFTTHRGIASMGQMLALGVTLTVVCNMVILPALIALRPSRFTNPPARH